MAKIIKNLTNPLIIMSTLVLAGGCSNENQSKEPNNNKENKGVSQSNQPTHKKDTKPIGTNDKSSTKPSSGKQKQRIPFTQARNEQPTEVDNYETYQQLYNKLKSLKEKIKQSDEISNAEKNKHKIQSILENTKIDDNQTQLILENTKIDDDKKLANSINTLLKEIKEINANVPKNKNNTLHKAIETHLNNIENALKSSLSVLLDKKQKRNSGDYGNIIGKNANALGFVDQAIQELNNFFTIQDINQLSTIKKSHPSLTIKELNTLVKQK